MFGYSDMMSQHYGRGQGRMASCQDSYPGRRPAPYLPEAGSQQERGEDQCREMFPPYELGGNHSASAYVPGNIPSDGTKPNLWNTQSNPEMLPPYNSNVPSYPLPPNRTSVSNKLPQSYNTAIQDCKAYTGTSHTHSGTNVPNSYPNSHHIASIPNPMLNSYGSCHSENHTSNVYHPSNYRYPSSLASNIPGSTMQSASEFSGTAKENMTAFPHWREYMNGHQQSEETQVPTASPYPWQWQHYNPHLQERCPPVHANFRHVPSSMLSHPARMDFIKGSKRHMTGHCSNGAPNPCRWMDISYKDDASGSQMKNYSHPTMVPHNVQAPDVNFKGSKQGSNEVNQMVVHHDSSHSEVMMHAVWVQRKSQHVSNYMRTADVQPGSNPQNEGSQHLNMSSYPSEFSYYNNFPVGGDLPSGAYPCSRYPDMYKNPIHLSKTGSLYPSGDSNLNLLAPPPPPPPPPPPTSTTHTDYNTCKKLQESAHGSRPNIPSMGMNRSYALQEQFPDGSACFVARRRSEVRTYEHAQENMCMETQVMSSLNSYPGVRNGSESLLYGNRVQGTNLALRERMPTDAAALQKGTIASGMLTQGNIGLPNDSGCQISSKNCSTTESRHGLCAVQDLRQFLATWDEGRECTPDIVSHESTNRDVTQGNKIIIDDVTNAPIFVISGVVTKDDGNIIDNICDKSVNQSSAESPVIQFYQELKAEENANNMHTEINSSIVCPSIVLGNSSDKQQAGGPSVQPHAVVVPVQPGGSKTNSENDANTRKEVAIVSQEKEDEDIHTPTANRTSVIVSKATTELKEVVDQKVVDVEQSAVVFDATGAVEHMEEKSPDIIEQSHTEGAVHKEINADVSNGLKCPAEKSSVEKDNSVVDNLPKKDDLLAVSNDLSENRKSDVIPTLSDKHTDEIHIDRNMESDSSEPNIPKDMPIIAPLTEDEDGEDVTSFGIFGYTTTSLKQNHAERTQPSSNTPDFKACINYEDKLNIQAKDQCGSNNLSDETSQSATNCNTISTSFAEGKNVLVEEDNSKIINRQELQQKDGDNYDNFIQKGILKTLSEIADMPLHNPTTDEQPEIKNRLKHRSKSLTSLSDSAVDIKMVEQRRHSLKTGGHFSELSDLVKKEHLKGTKTLQGSEKKKSLKEEKEDEDDERITDRRSEKKEILESCNKISNSDFTNSDRPKIDDGEEKFDSCDVPTLKPFVKRTTLSERVNALDVVESEPQIASFKNYVQKREELEPNFVEGNTNAPEEGISRHNRPGECIQKEKLSNSEHKITAMESVCNETKLPPPVSLKKIVPRTVQVKRTVMRICENPSEQCKTYRSMKDALIKKIKECSKPFKHSKCENLLTPFTHTKHNRVPMSNPVSFDDLQKSNIPQKLTLRDIPGKTLIEANNPLNLGKLEGEGFESEPVNVAIVKKSSGDASSTEDVGEICSQECPATQVESEVPKEVMYDAENNQETAIQEDKLLTEDTEGVEKVISDGVENEITEDICTPREDSPQKEENINNITQGETSTGDQESIVYVNSDTVLQLDPELNAEEHEGNILLALEADSVELDDSLHSNLNPPNMNETDSEQCVDDSSSNFEENYENEVHCGSDENLKASELMFTDDSNQHGAPEVINDIYLPTADENSTISDISTSCAQDSDRESCDSFHISVDDYVPEIGSEILLHDISDMTAFAIPLPLERNQENERIDTSNSGVLRTENAGLSDASQVLSESSLCKVNTRNADKPESTNSSSGEKLDSKQDKVTVSGPSNHRWVKPSIFDPVDLQPDKLADSIAAEIRNCMSTNTTSVPQSFVNEEKLRKELREVMYASSESPVVEQTPYLQFNPFKYSRRKGFGIPPKQRKPIAAIKIKVQIQRNASSGEESQSSKGHSKASLLKKRSPQRTDDNVEGDALHTIKRDKHGIIASSPFDAKSAVKKNKTADMEKLIPCESERKVKKSDTCSKSPVPVATSSKNEPSGQVCKIKIMNQGGVYRSTIMGGVPKNDHGSQNVITHTKCKSSESKLPEADDAERNAETEESYTSSSEAEESEQSSESDFQSLDKNSFSTTFHTSERGGEIDQPVEKCDQLVIQPGKVRKDACKEEMHEERTYITSTSNPALSVSSETPHQNKTPGSSNRNTASDMFVQSTSKQPEQHIQVYQAIKTNAMNLISEYQSESESEESEKQEESSKFERRETEKTCKILIENTASFPLTTYDDDDDDAENSEIQSEDLSEFQSESCSVMQSESDEIEHSHHSELQTEESGIEVTKSIITARISTEDVHSVNKHEEILKEEELSEDNVVTCEDGSSSLQHANEFHEKQSAGEEIFVDHAQAQISKPLVQSTELCNDLEISSDEGSGMLSPQIENVDVMKDAPSVIETDVTEKETDTYPALCNNLEITNSCPESILQRTHNFTDDVKSNTFKNSICNPNEISDILEENIKDNIETIEIQHSDTGINDQASEEKSEKSTLGKSKSLVEAYNIKSEPDVEENKDNGAQSDDINNTLEEHNISNSPQCFKENGIKEICQLSGSNDEKLIEEVVKQNSDGKNEDKCSDAVATSKPILENIELTSSQEANVLESKVTEFEEQNTTDGQDYIREKSEHQPSAVRSEIESSQSEEKSTEQEYDDDNMDTTKEITSDGTFPEIVNEAKYVSEELKSVDENTSAEDSIRETSEDHEVIEDADKDDDAPAEIINSSGEISPEICTDDRNSGPTAQSSCKSDGTVVSTDVVGTEKLHDNAILSLNVLPNQASLEIQNSGNTSMGMETGDNHLDSSVDHELKVKTEINFSVTDGSLKEDNSNTSLVPKSDLALNCADLNVDQEKRTIIDDENNEQVEMTEVNSDSNVSSEEVVIDNEEDKVMPKLDAETLPSKTIQKKASETDEESDKIDMPVLIPALTSDASCDETEPEDEKLMPILTAVTKQSRLSNEIHTSHGLQNGLKKPQELDDSIDDIPPLLEIYLPEETVTNVQMHKSENEATSKFEHGIFSHDVLQKRNSEEGNSFSGHITKERCLPNINTRIDMLLSAHEYLEGDSTFISKSDYAIDKKRQNADIQRIQYSQGETHEELTENTAQETQSLSTDYSIPIFGEKIINHRPCDRVTDDSSFPGQYVNQSASDYATKESNGENTNKCLNHSNGVLSEGTVVMKLNSQETARGQGYFKDDVTIKTASTSSSDSSKLRVKHSVKIESERELEQKVRKVISNVNLQKQTSKKRTHNNLKNTAMSLRTVAQSEKKMKQVQRRKSNTTFNKFGKIIVKPFTKKWFKQRHRLAVLIKLREINAIGCAISQEFWKTVNRYFTWRKIQSTAASRCGQDVQKKKQAKENVPSTPLKDQQSSLSVMCVQRNANTPLDLTCDGTHAKDSASVFKQNMFQNHNTSTEHKTSEKQFKMFHSENLELAIKKPELSIPVMQVQNTDTNVSRDSASKSSVNIGSKNSETKNARDFALNLKKQLTLYTCPNCKKFKRIDSKSLYDIRTFQKHVQASGEASESSSAVFKIGKVLSRVSSIDNNARRRFTHPVPTMRSIEKSQDSPLFMPWAERYKGTKRNLDATKCEKDEKETQESVGDENVCSNLKAKMEETNNVPEEKGELTSALQSTNLTRLSLDEFSSHSNNLDESERKNVVACKENLEQIEECSDSNTIQSIEDSNHSSESRACNVPDNTAIEKTEPFTSKNIDLHIEANGSHCVTLPEPKQQRDETSDFNSETSTPQEVLTKNDDLETKVYSAGELLPTNILLIDDAKAAHTVEDYIQSDNFQEGELCAGISEESGLTIPQQTVNESQTVIVGEDKESIQNISADFQPAIPSECNLVIADKSEENAKLRTITPDLTPKDTNIMDRLHEADVQCSPMQEVEIDTNSSAFLDMGKIEECAEPQEITVENDVDVANEKSAAEESVISNLPDTPDLGIEIGDEIQGEEKYAKPEKSPIASNMLTDDDVSIIENEEATESIEFELANTPKLMDEDSNHSIDKIETEDDEKLSLQISSIVPHTENASIVHETKEEGNNETESVETAVSCKIKVTEQNLTTQSEMKIDIVSSPTSTNLESAVSHENFADDDTISIENESEEERTPPITPEGYIQNDDDDETDLQKSTTCDSVSKNNSEIVEENTNFQSTASSKLTDSAILEVERGLDSEEEKNDDMLQSSITLAKETETDGFSVTLNSKMEDVIEIGKQTEKAKSPFSPQVAENTVQVVVDSEIKHEEVHSPEIEQEVRHADEVGKTEEDDKSELSLSSIAEADNQPIDKAVDEDEIEKMRTPRSLECLQRTEDAENLRVIAQSGKGSRHLDTVTPENVVSKLEKVVQEEQSKSKPVRKNRRKLLLSDSKYTTKKYANCQKQSQIVHFEDNSVNMETPQCTIQSLEQDGIVNIDSKEEKLSNNNVELQIDIIEPTSHTAHSDDEHVGNSLQFIARVSNECNEPSDNRNSENYISLQNQVENDTACNNYSTLKRKFRVQSIEEDGDSENEPVTKMPRTSHTELDSEFDVSVPDIVNEFDQCNEIEVIDLEETSEDGDSDKGSTGVPGYGGTRNNLFGNNSNDEEQSNYTSGSVSYGEDGWSFTDEIEEATESMADEDETDSVVIISSDESMDASNSAKGENENNIMSLIISSVERIPQEVFNMQGRNVELHTSENLSMQSCVSPSQNLSSDAVNSSEDQDEIDVDAQNAWSEDQNVETEDAREYAEEVFEPDSEMITFKNAMENIMKNDLDISKVNVEQNENLVEDQEQTNVANENVGRKSVENNTADIEPIEKLVADLQKYIDDDRPLPHQDDLRALEDDKVNEENIEKLSVGSETEMHVVETAKLSSVEEKQLENFVDDTTSISEPQESKLDEIAVLKLEKESESLEISIENKKSEDARVEECQEKKIEILSGDIGNSAEEESLEKQKCKIKLGNTEENSLIDNRSKQLSSESQTEAESSYNMVETDDKSVVPVEPDSENLKEDHVPNILDRCNEITPNLNTIEMVEDTEVINDKLSIVNEETCKNENIEGLLPQKEIEELEQKQDSEKYETVSEENVPQDSVMIVCENNEVPEIENQIEIGVDEEDKTCENRQLCFKMDDENSVAVPNDLINDKTDEDVEKCNVSPPLTQDVEENILNIDSFENDNKLERSVDSGIRFANVEESVLENVKCSSNITQDDELPCTVSITNKSGDELDQRDIENEKGDGYRKTTTVENSENSCTTEDDAAAVEQNKGMETLCIMKENTDIPTTFEDDGSVEISAQMSIETHQDSEISGTNRHQEDEERPFSSLINKKEVAVKRSFEESGVGNDSGNHISKKTMFESTHSVKSDCEELVEDLHQQSELLAAKNDTTTSKTAPICCEEENARKKDDDVQKWEVQYPKDSSIIHHLGLKYVGERKEYCATTFSPRYADSSKHTEMESTCGAGEWMSQKAYTEKIPTMSEVSTDNAVSCTISESSMDDKHQYRDGGCNWSPEMQPLNQACMSDLSEESRKILPRVIIRKTNGTSYRSFLRDSCSSDQEYNMEGENIVGEHNTSFLPPYGNINSHKWQPVVRIMRDGDIDELALRVVDKKQKMDNDSEFTTEGERIRMKHRKHGRLKMKLHRNRIEAPWDVYNYRLHGDYDWTRRWREQYEERKATPTSSTSEMCEECPYICSTKTEKIMHLRQHPFHCQRCIIAFHSQDEMMSHFATYHPRTKEQHYCVLCERSFSSAHWFQKHLQSREHLQLEKTQRRTIQTLFVVFTGEECSSLKPLTEEEYALLNQYQYNPISNVPNSQAYHQATPLQLAVQDLIWRRAQCGGIGLKPRRFREAPSGSRFERPMTDSPVYTSGACTSSESTRSSVSRNSCVSDTTSGNEDVGSVHMDTSSDVSLPQMPNIHVTSSGVIHGPVNVNCPTPVTKDSSYTSTGVSSFTGIGALGDRSTQNTMKRKATDLMDKFITSVEKTLSENDQNASTYSSTDLWPRLLMAQTDESNSALGFDPVGPQAHRVDPPVSAVSYKDPSLDLLDLTNSVRIQR